MSVFRKKELPEAVQLQEIDERHDLSQQIFFRREHNGWTQEELAETAGLTQSQIAKLEAGDSNPTLRTLVKVAHALGCRLHQLVAPEHEPWAAGEILDTRGTRVFVNAIETAFGRPEGGAPALECIASSWSVPERIWIRAESFDLPRAVECDDPSRPPRWPKRDRSDLVGAA